MDKHYVYLIACQGDANIYVKIGLTSSIQRRLSNIQTGCPHPITHAFVILSEYREEVQGLEKLLHVLLKPERLRAKSEWYVINRPAPWLNFRAESVIGALAVMRPAC